MFPLRSGKCSFNKRKTFLSRKAQEATETDKPTTEDIIDKAMEPQESLYDFSGVASDLAILRSQLFTLNIGNGSNGSLGGGNSSSRKDNSSLVTTVTMDRTRGTYLNKELEEPDDEEWYPPSPPIYDVADKLIEINREHENDPFPAVHMAGRLRWRPEDRLVQIKWLYSSDGETNFMSETEDENSSDENFCGGLAAQLAKEMQARLNLSLCNIEDVVLEEPDGLDYDDEDFEEPSIAENIEVKSSLRDSEIISQMEVLHNNHDEMSVSSNSSSSESCRTTMTSLKNNVNEAKTAISHPPSSTVHKSPSPNINSADNSQRSEHSVSTSSTTTRLKSTSSAGNATTKIIVTNSSLSESLKKPEVSKTTTTSDSANNGCLKKDPPRPTSRPRTKTTVVRTNPLPKLRSSSLPKSDTTPAAAAATTRGSNSEHAKRLSCNNNNSCSSSGEEGSSSSSSSAGSSSSSSSSSYMLSRSGSGLSRSCSLQPGKSRSESRESSARKVITNSTENRPKKAASTSLSTSTSASKTSVYLGGPTTPPGLNGVPARPAPTSNDRFLQHRKNSRNSLSSNSSVSSQTTEDSNISNLNFKRKVHRHPSVIADVISPQNPYFLQWKMRKREEKKLRARKSYLEQQMRRH